MNPCHLTRNSNTSPHILSFLLCIANVLQMYREGRTRVPHLTQGKLAVSWPQPLCCHELGRAAAWVPFGEGRGLENGMFNFCIC